MQVNDGVMLVAMRAQFVLNLQPEPYKDKTNSHLETLRINEEGEIVGGASEVIYADHDLDPLNRVRPGNLPCGVQAKLFQIFDSVLNHGGNLAIGKSGVNENRRAKTRGRRSAQRCINGSTCPWLPNWSRTWQYDAVAFVS